MAGNALDRRPSPSGVKQVGRDEGVLLWTTPSTSAHRGSVTAIARATLPVSHTSIASENRLIATASICERSMFSLFSQGNKVQQPERLAPFTKTPSRRGVVYVCASGASSTKETSFTSKLVPYIRNTFFRHLRFSFFSAGSEMRTLPTREAPTNTTTAMVVRSEELC